MKRDKWVPNKWSFLCSDHFKESDFKVGKGLKRRLKPDAIPSLFNFNNICNDTIHFAGVSKKFKNNVLHNLEFF